MKLAWLSEGGYSGKVPREQTANAGVLWAWMSNLEVDHFPILDFKHAPTSGYDYLILQVPKTPHVRELLLEKDIVFLSVTVFDLTLDCRPPPLK